MFGRIKSKIFYIHLFLLLSLLSFMSCSNDDEWENDNYLYPEFEKWFNYLCSPELGGRYSGSEGIKKAENYICDIIGRSDPLTCTIFQTPECEMTNIIYHVEGESDSLIVIGAHYDAYGYEKKQPLPGADDNLSGVSVLLNAIKKIQSGAISPYYSVDFCFFDGEEIGRYGSWHYVKNHDKIKLFINIDTCGNPNHRLTLGYSKYSPDLLLEFTNMQNNLNMDVFEYDPVSYTTDCEPFETYNIPFVSIGNEAFSYYQHTFMDNVTHISFSRLDKISESLVLYLKTK